MLRGGLAASLVVLVSLVAGGSAYGGRVSVDGKVVIANLSRHKAMVRAD